MSALKLGLLRCAEQAPLTTHRQQQVLAAEQGVVFSQPQPFTLHVFPVQRVVQRYILPVVAEVTPDPVAPLHLQVQLLLLL